MPLTLLVFFSHIFIGTLFKTMSILISRLIHTYPTTICHYNRQPSLVPPLSPHPLLRLTPVFHVATAASAGHPSPHYTAQFIHLACSRAGRQWATEGRKPGGQTRSWAVSFVPSPAPHLCRSPLPVLNRPPSLCRALYRVMRDYRAGADSASTNIPNITKIVEKLVLKQLTSGFRGGFSIN